MKTMLRWVAVALSVAVVLGCQVERLLRGSGGGNGPPADTVAARVAFSTQPKNAMVNQTITPPVTVVVTDRSGNPVPSYSGSVTIALGANGTDARLSGANTATATNGVAMFPGLSVDKAGSRYTLTATSSGLSGATSAPFDVSARPAPPATHVAFIAQPSTTRAGDPISPALQVAAEDSTGAVVSTYTGAITVAIGANPVAGALSGTRAVDATGGVASFSSLSIDKAGTGYTLKASASGLTGATSSTFNVTVPPPTTGSLTVSAATTGSNLDPDGYHVSVDGGSAKSISDNGSVIFNDLVSGSHTVAMTGLASNCSASSTSQSVTVPAGGSTSASFAITCAAPPPMNHPPVVDAGKRESIVEGVPYQLNASFTDVDGDGPWTYDVNWGDGTSSSGTLSAQGAIGPAHTYLLPNDYRITVTVTDAHGASGTDSKTLHVTL
jgi:hypothetical protein